MIYFNTSGSRDSYCIFTRDDTAKFPFINNLYYGNGSSNNVQSWKTEQGAIRAINRKFPDWQHETSEQLKMRKEEYKNKSTIR